MDLIKSFNEFKKGNFHTRSFSELLNIHETLGFPSDKYKTVHVAGTNGKGTVSLNIAKGLNNSGYKTGLLTSPHFMCKTERIAIDGVNITNKEIERIYEENKEILETLAFFEILTFIAFIYFAEQKVHYAVIEVGLGGLKDATNVINSILCVITNLAYDHVEYLGPTLDDIAYNKAGIIKPNIPVVLGYNALHYQCYKAAKEKNAEVFEIKISDSDYLKENKRIADTALMVLGIKPLELIFTLPVRYEVHGNIIFDMAHNEDGFLALKRKVQMEYPGKKVIALWNMSTTKSAKSCLEILRSYCEEVYFFHHDFLWLLSKEDASKLGVREYAGESSEVILVCGSIYFLSEAKSLLLNGAQLQ